MLTSLSVHDSSFGWGCSILVLIAMGFLGVQGPAQPPTQFETQKLAPAEVAASQYHGTSVAISGSTIVSGVPIGVNGLNFTASGSAYVHVFDSGSWV